MRKIKRILPFLLCLSLFSGCGGKESTQDQKAAENLPATSEEGAKAGEAGSPKELADGVYTAEFCTDSSMFHVSEACEGKGALTVEKGKMSIHISLASKNIVKLYAGLAEDAKKEGADLILPTEDTVTYSDGLTETVYGFDVPVPALEKEFDLALVGKKGVWYDHKVSVSSPVPAVGDLTLETEIRPEYAEGFAIYQYEGGYEVIDVKEGFSYLAVPPGKEAPDGLPEDLAVLQKPLDQIYVAGTATMSMFSALGGLDQVGFCSLRKEEWHVEAAREAMAAGAVKFAGKYSEPDYEMLVDEGCALAVESQMILHSPRVMEQLGAMGIPVFVDCSSNEEHPLGRAEWIKVYGALLDKEEEAADFFGEQAKVMDGLEGFPNTEQTVAYFYISSSGQAVVRTGTDYIAKMIEIAGGRYPLSHLGDGKRSTMAVSMEEFYTACADADYIIYNASIDHKLSSVEDLTAKDAVLENMKAVKEGNVFCTDKDFYQAADTACQMISDIHVMLTGGDEDDMVFLHRVGK